MAGDGAQFGGSSPVERLRHRVARLPQLRGEGLRLVSEGDIAEVEAWHGRWAALLDEIRTQLDLEAPRETELVLWPSVNGAQPLGRIRVGLVRATVGCRELELLVGELGGSHEDKAAETPDALLLPEEPLLGATYVGAGRRFEGAIRLRQLIEPAQESLVVVDSYMDDGTFALAAAAPDGISRRFLSSDHTATRPRVTQAWADWQGQWEGVGRQNLMRPTDTDDANLLARACCRLAGSASAAPACVPPESRAPMTDAAASRCGAGRTHQAPASDVVR